MATSGTIKASPEGRDLKVRSSSGPLGLVLEVHVSSTRGMYLL